jgi:hypothetical protein
MHPFSSRSSQFFDASWVTAFRHSHLHQSFFDCESLFNTPHRLASTRRPATRAAAGVVRAGHGLGVWCGFSPTRRLDAASQGPCTTVRLVWEDGQRGQQCDPVRRSHSEDRRGRGRGGDVDSAGAFRERARPSFPCPAVRCAAHWTAALAPAATRLDLGGCAKNTKEAAGVPTSQPHGQSVV